MRPPVDHGRQQLPDAGVVVAWCGAIGFGDGAAGTAAGGLVAVAALRALAAAAAAAALAGAASRLAEGAGAVPHRRAASPDPSQVGSC